MKKSVKYISSLKNIKKKSTLQSNNVDKTMQIRNKTLAGVHHNQ